MNRGPGKLFCARNCAPGLTCSEREVSDRSLSCSGLRCCRLWFRLWFDLPNRKNIIRITIVLQKPCYTQFLLLSSLSYRRKPRCPSTLFFTLSSRNILVSLVDLPTSLYLGQQPHCVRYRCPPLDTVNGCGELTSLYLGQRSHGVHYRCPPLDIVNGCGELTSLYLSQRSHGVRYRCLPLDTVSGCVGPWPGSEQDST